MDDRSIAKVGRGVAFAIGVALLAATANAQGTKELTGTANYRERMLLPPDAIFEATLEEVTKKDAPGVVISRGRLAQPQAPVRFSIRYDPAQIVEDRVYAVRARIIAGGEVMFVSDQAYLVLIQGHGTDIAQVLLRRAKGSEKVDHTASELPSRFTQRQTIRGMFRMMADAPTLTECETGQRVPVAMEGEYKSLESAYTKVRRQPADELLVDLEGQVAMRPNPDTGRPFPTLLVAKYVGIWPGETCGGAIGSPKFGETDWKLTRLENQPVLLEEKQREPSLTFRTEESKASGFGGCNALTGDYKSNGEELSIGTLAVTRMDCAQGADLEATFLKVLARVRRWKIVQQHLELYDEGGAVVARFEARSPN